MDEFVYNIMSYELKGKNILTITNYKSPKSDKFYFTSAILNLENKNFLAKDTKIDIHKNIFDNSKNDPRIKGVSHLEIKISPRLTGILQVVKTMAVHPGQLQLKK